MFLQVSKSPLFSATVAVLGGLAVLSGCNGGGASSASREEGDTGRIQIDGSSTVYPITEAVAEDFQGVHPGIQVTVGISGTGGGFKRFCIGETDISNASRPIAESEKELAAENGIEFIEIPVAFDGLTVVIHPSNDWAESLTVEELKRIWEPGSQINNWSQIRPGFPDVPLRLYGPGTDSGTFDYFTKAIVGEESASRPDFQASEDDNSLVTGVAGDRGALGYFGYVYFDSNRERVKAVAIDAGNGPVAPDQSTIETGRYAPLARPEFIYVSLAAAERPEVQKFVQFYLTEGRALVREVGYVPLPDEVYELAWERFENRITGSLFEGTAVGFSIKDLLEAKQ